MIRQAIPSIVICLAVLTSLISLTSGHGYMIQPASRSSAWRKGFDTPNNYDDVGLNCGGFSYQWSSTNDGKCGACGDGYGWSVKPNEDIGGTYVQGVITGTYESGSVMEVQVVITAYHMGWFEFRLCRLSSPDQKVTQACLNQTLLAEDGTGITRFYLENSLGSAGDYYYSLRLPSYTCENCVLQWTYNVGNSWGCEATGCGIGMGKQENFKNCADIKLVADDQATTSTSTVAPTQAPTSLSTQTSTSDPTETSTTATTQAPTPDPTVAPTTTVLQETTTEPIVTAATMATGCTCIAVPPYDTVSGIQDWCCTNCAQGYCPSSHCSC